MKKLRLRLWIMILLSLSLVCTAFPIAASASERRVVKVGFFPMDGYHITNPDGSRGGIDVEYLDAVSAYTNWKVEYVDCESWEEALQLLSEKKIDLVGSAQYSDERAQIFDYASLPSGYTFGVIATNADGTVAYEDFTAMENASFGVVKDYVRKNEFMQYMAGNGVKDFTVREYSSTAELCKALDVGEVDAMVHTFTEIREGMRLIGRFAPRPFYYISYKDNEEVMRELDQAISNIKMNRPELETFLMNRYYFDRFDKAVMLTTEEKQFLEKKASLNVGYLSGHYPFSYNNGEGCQGLSRQMLESCFSLTGMELNYIEFSNEEEAENALAAGNVDLLSYSMNAEEKLNEKGLTIARSYVELSLVVVSSKKNGNNMKTIATIPYIDYVAQTSGLDGGAEGLEVHLLSTERECLDKLKAKEVDAVLCDGYLAEDLLRIEPGYEGFVIQNVFSSELPVSVVVREKDEMLKGILSKTVIDIDSRSIDTYMLKENVYPVSIENFISEHSVAIVLILIGILLAVVLVARHIILDEKKIAKLMYKDDKLDIWNVNYFIYTGENKLAVSPRKEDYAVAYINISQFSHYNAIYGWNAGDRMLESIVETLKKVVDEENEIYAKHQSDHFLLFLIYEDKQELLERLQKIQKRMEEDIYSATGSNMSLEMGVYCIPQDEKLMRNAIERVNEVMEFADVAENKSIVLYNDDLKQKLKDRHDWEKLLDSVEIEKDFVAFYQPKVNIHTGEIVGAEALIRFLNPQENGTVKAPGFFIPYYEKTGRVEEIDFFVLKRACRMLRRRLDAGECVVPVSCNFSRLHFMKPDFTERFESVLNEYGISKELIEVEITETLVLEELQQKAVLETLDVLHRKNIILSIDDFGSGYSSFGVFEQIPASVVKLDRSFLLNKKDYARKVAIMRGIADLVNDLGADVVCEGVETAEDVALMQEIGASVAQGYYYSKPVSEEEFERALTERTFTNFLF